MSKINLKKRVKTERFLKAFFNFLVESQTIQLIVDEKGCLKDGGYLDYYLIHASDFTRKGFEDHVKFCRTIEHLSNLISLQEEEKCKTITVKRVLSLANADIIFKYEFNSKKLKEWQQQIFELLTFQNLSC